MTRRRSADVARAIKALTASGVGIARIEIDSTGKIAIIAATGSAGSMDDLDRELVEWEARHGEN
jgi:hypothetical protein